MDLGIAETSQRGETGNEFPAAANQMTRRRRARGRGRCEPIMDDCRSVHRRAKINLAAHVNPQG
ncbi:MAG: hypothetical protein CR217_09950 [Beijerinckiaceae bacterium]|nr:MAG: hypothetical protein CR217_09950 [Beijerinckiaceae bacterium]